VKEIGFCLNNNLDEIIYFRRKFRRNIAFYQYLKYIDYKKEFGREDIQKIFKS